MTSFLKAQRRPGESILAYFARIVILYKSSANITDVNWGNSFSHILPIYSKIYNSCYDTQKINLARKAEDGIDKCTLKLTDLQNILIQVSKIDEDKILSESPSVNTLSSGTTTRQASYQERPGNQKDKPKFKKGVTCYFCGKEGHFKRDCFRYLKKKKEAGEANPRETKTDGRSE